MRHLILFTRFGRRDKLQLYGLWSLLSLITCVLAYVLCQASCNFGFNIEKTKHKNPKKIDGWNHQRGDKKGRPKKGQKTHKPHEPKEEGESYSFSW
jgi:hypothetical protein